MQDSLLEIEECKDLKQELSGGTILSATIPTATAAHGWLSVLHGAC